jgi:excisionase family DNA binding protein
MIKKFYSKRVKKHWKYDAKEKLYWSHGYDIRLVDGRRVRQAGFMSEADAVAAVGAIRAAEKELKHGFVADSAHPRLSKMVAKRLAEGRPQAFDNGGAHYAGQRDLMDGARLISLAEAAAKTGIPESRLRAAVKAGDLPAAQIGKGLKLRHSDVLRHVERAFSAGAVQPAPADTAEVLKSHRQAQRARLRASIEQWRAAISKAKPVVRRERFSGDWRALALTVCPGLEKSAVDMLLTSTPYEIALEQVARRDLGVTSRHLKRILAEKE